MRLRLDSDPGALMAWLNAHEYPIEWTLPALRDRCVKAVILDGTRVAGYVWAAWSDYDTLEFHACIGYAHRRVWLTDEMMRDLCNLARYCGADHIRCRPVPEMARGLTALLTRRFGFEVSDGGVLTKEIRHGVLFPSETKGPARAHSSPDQ